MDYTSYVNTNIGTIGHLLKATQPGVQTPHGALTAAPVFRPGVGDRYNSDKIFGFQAGPVSVMPLADATSDFMSNASVFDHDLETARPDYYSVLLEDTDIVAEMTAYKNIGIYRFSGENCNYLATPSAMANTP